MAEGRRVGRGRRWEESKYGIVHIKIINDIH